MDNVKIHEPFGNSVHNQIHFYIKVNSKSTNKNTGGKFPKGKYKHMRRYFAKLDWNTMVRNKSAIKCWNTLKYVIENTIDQFVP